MTVISDTMLHQYGVATDTPYSESVIHRLKSELDKQIPEIIRQVFDNTVTMMELSDYIKLISIRYDINYTSNVVDDTNIFTKVWKRVCSITTKKPLDVLITSSVFEISYSIDFEFKNEYLLKLKDYDKYTEFTENIDSYIFIELNTKLDNLFYDSSI